MSAVVRTGGCLCGAVRYEVKGAPYKSGLCHCTTCRQVTGSAFLAYADWRLEDLKFTGSIATYQGRSFCPVCGSRLFSLTDKQAEIYLGTLDDTPNGIAPLGRRTPAVVSCSRTVGLFRTLRLFPPEKCRIGRGPAAYRIPPVLDSLSITSRAPHRRITFATTPAEDVTSDAGSGRRETLFFL